MFEFSTLTVGYIKHTFRLPNLPAAHTFHALREDNFIAGFGQGTGVNSSHSSVGAGYQCYSFVCHRVMLVMKNV